MSDTPIFYNLQTAGNVTAITGRLSDLETTVNTNLVAAINEIDGKFPVSIANGGTGGTTATEARTNLSVMTGVQLYYNAAGSSGTIELSDEIKNYQCIDICFFIDVYSSLKYTASRIHNLGENSVITTLNLDIDGMYSSGGTSHPRVNVFAAGITITGNSLTWSRSHRAYITDTMTPVVQATTTDTPAIYKIIGYTY